MSPLDRASLESLYFSINFGALWLFLPGAFLLKFSLFEKLEPYLELSPLDLKLWGSSKIVSSIIIVISKCYHYLN